MRDRSLAAVAGLLTVLALLVRLIPVVLFETGWTQRLARLVPFAETTGEGVTVVVLLVESIHPLVTVAIGAGIGYYAVRAARDRGRRRFATVVAAGSATTVVAGSGLVVLGSGILGGGVGGFTVAYLLGAVVRFSLDTTLVLTVGAVAGTVLAGGDADDGPPTGTPDPQRPTEASTDRGSTTTR